MVRIQLNKPFHSLILSAGGLLCDAHTGTGVPPASLAEWTLGTNGAPDYYDSEQLNPGAKQCLIRDGY